MEASSAKSYRGWRAGVDSRLQQIYCITVEDAGFDEDYLIKQWRSDETAHEFFEWFGIKFDLTPDRMP
jgi:hypothetical protein